MEDLVMPEPWFDLRTGENSRVFLEPVFMGDVFFLLLKLLPIIVTERPFGGENCLV